MAPDLALGKVPQLLLKNDAQVYMPFVGDMVFTITNQYNRCEGAGMMSQQTSSICAASGLRKMAEAPGTRFHVPREGVGTAIR